MAGELESRAQSPPRRWAAGHLPRPAVGRRPLKALRRVGTGDHLPHPHIGYRRVGALQIVLGQPLMVELDGQPVLRASNLSIRVEPAALVVVV